jgi:hypothetical protein
VPIDIVTFAALKITAVVIAGVGAMAFVALATHRIVFGRWRGSDGHDQCRSTNAVVMIVVGWIAALAVVWSLSASRFGSAFVWTSLALCSMLAGCAENYGEHL